MSETDDAPRALVVCGSRRQPSRTRALAERVADHAAAAGLAVRTLDLAEIPLEPFDGRDLNAYDDRTRQAVESVVAADVLLVGTPIYFAGYAGGLKDLLDHLPYERFAEDRRAAGLFATGRDERHRLVPDSQLRATLVYLGVDVATPTAFATEADFEEFDLAADAVDDRLRTVVEATAALYGRQ